MYNAGRRKYEEETLGMRGTSTPLVSIIIPCYNHENFVQDCLRSLLAQEYTNIEVILCDDASRDKSFAKAEEIKPIFEDKKIKFVLLKNEKNMGITKTLNRMICKAEGEYIKILASDDMLAPSFMKHMVRFMEDNPHIVMAFSNAVKVEEKSVYPPDEKNMIENVLLNAPDCAGNVLEKIYTANFVPAPAMMMRKKVYEEIGVYDENIKIEDWEMTLRVLKNYPEGIQFFDEVLVYYRMNENSVTSISQNAGAQKRVEHMHKNSVLIAKKYKREVSYKIYIKKMFDLYVKYYWKKFYLFLTKPRK